LVLLCGLQDRWVDLDMPGLLGTVIRG